MTKSTISSESEKVNQLASEYASRGYTIYRADSGFPAFVSDYRPDLVATSPNDKVIVEVKALRLPTVDQRISEMARVIRMHPEWRFEFVAIDVRDESPLSLEEAHQILRQASVLLRQQLNEAALMIGWSAAEAVLRNLLVLDRDARRPEGSTSSVRIVKAAFSLGLIGRDVFDVMLAATYVRNTVAHGLQYTGPGSVGVVAASLLRALEQTFSAIESGDADQESHADTDAMVHWFHEHYEDPARGVPFESAEGGYIYYLGGPYDPWEVLWAQFPDADPNVIDEAASRIVPQGSEWVRKGQY